MDVQEVTIDDLDFNYKPPKCKHCGLIKGYHRAETFQCPAKWSRGRIGYTHYLETVFEEKPSRKKKDGKA